MYCIRDVRRASNFQLPYMRFLAVSGVSRRLQGDFLFGSFLSLPSCAHQATQLNCNLGYSSDLFRELYGTKVKMPPMPPLLVDWLGGGRRDSHGKWA